MKNPFLSHGSWFKGNLHLHTNQSDGELEPQEAIDLYAGADYDFLAITDHRRLTDPQQFDDRGMALLPGIEFDGSKSDVDSRYHLVGIGARLKEKYPPIVYEENMGPQAMVDDINSMCEFCFCAHPYWSSLVLGDLVELENLLGVEVYNTTCDRGIGRGLSTSHWDNLLARGKRLYGFAVDDAHFHYEDGPVASIMVRAEECTSEAIMEAVMAGQFYSSNGPEIRDISVDEDEVVVECSPCRQVNLISPHPGLGTTTWKIPQKPPYERVRLPLGGGTKLFRIECIDMEGRTAWSNPFWLSES